MKTIKHFLQLSILLVLLASCESRKNIILFQDIEHLNDSNQNQKQINNPVIQIGDILSISVSAIDQQAVIPFNLPVVAINNISGSVNGIAKQQGYLVNANSSIVFPIIGEINLENLTLVEARAMVSKKLEAYIKEPIVNIEIINYQITVLGDVARPGTFKINNERVSLLQAIGFAGGMNIQGKRNNVLIIRENQGVKTYKRVDLRKMEVLNSEYYYLKQNDVVYIEPNKTKINSSKYGPAVSVSVSIASVLITLISVLTR
ncbi:MAG: polysaccharide biosynthesis/export family protein [Flavobacteriales bacterium]